MERTLDQELSELKARAIQLQQEIDNEHDSEKPEDVKLAKLAAATALDNRIAALQYEITEQRKSRGNFSFSSC